MRLGRQRLRLLQRDSDWQSVCSLAGHCSVTHDDRRFTRRFTKFAGPHHLICRGARGPSVQRAVLQAWPGSDRQGVTPAALDGSDRLRRPCSSRQGGSDRQGDPAAPPRFALRPLQHSGCAHMVRAASARPLHPPRAVPSAASSSDSEPWPVRAPASQALPLVDDPVFPSARRSSSSAPRAPLRPPHLTLARSTPYQWHQPPSGLRPRCMSRHSKLSEASSVSSLLFAQVQSRPSERAMKSG
jgi:hypothetical protein